MDDKIEVPILHRPQLLDRDQRFGIMPSFWFWEGNEDAWRLIRFPMLTFYVTAFITISAISGWATGYMVSSGLYTLCLGAVERYIRRRAEERRDRVLAELDWRPTCGVDE